jgi:hypothetical protein
MDELVSDRGTNSFGRDLEFGDRSRGFVAGAIYHWPIKVSSLAPAFEQGLGDAMSSEGLYVQTEVETV